MSQAKAGLYVHVPFCSSICPYCDFAVTTTKPNQRVLYRDALVREIAHHREASIPIDTVYFGGGTPSLLELPLLESILESLRRELPVCEDAKVFLEANPEHVDRERVRSWRALGVSFLSLGVQSFVDEELAFLFRRHNAEQALHAVEVAIEAGFETVSLDLIFGLPGQDEASLLQSVHRATESAVTHISCYQLTVHEGTPFHRFRERGRLLELEESRQASLFLTLRRHLREAGFEGYEVSNFARGVDHRSEHNAKYWDHTPYLGLGPSAHAFDGQVRSWNHAKFRDWRDRLEQGQSAVAGREELSEAERILEHVMLGLRTSWGIDVAQIQGRYGVDLVELNRERFSVLERDGLMRREGTRLILSDEGMAIADGIVRDLHLGNGGEFKDRHHP